MTERIKLKLPLVVEGRYDKNTLMQIFDAKILTTDGFGIFNSKEKQALIKKFAERDGVILLTDSDAGGKQIRTFLINILGKDKVFNLYIPELAGKEKRKKAPSKAGLLGVEGMEREVLVRVLSPFILKDAAVLDFTGGRSVTKLDFYNDGLSGGVDSSEKREKLARYFGLPHDMTAKALLEAVNLLFGYEKYKSALDEVFSDQKQQ